MSDGTGGPISAEKSIQYITALVAASQEMVASSGPRTVPLVIAVLREALFCFWDTREMPLTDPRWPRSAAAAGSQPGEIAFTYVIPQNILLKELLNRTAEVRPMEEFLAANRIGCFIKRDEEDRLAEAGLRQSMPENWTWGDDPWERFRHVGIELAPPLN